MSVDNLAHIRAGLASAQGLADFDPTGRREPPVLVGGRYRVDAFLQRSQLTIYTGTLSDPRTTILRFRPGSFRADSLTAVEWSHGQHTSKRGVVKRETMTDGEIIRLLELGYSTLELTWSGGELNRAYLLDTPPGMRSRSLTYERGRDKWSHHVEGDRDMLLRLLRHGPTHLDRLVADPTQITHIRGIDIRWNPPEDKLRRRIRHKARIDEITEALGGQVVQGA